jgi:hypothetical protein
VLTGVGVGVGVGVAVGFGVAVGVTVAVGLGVGVGVAAADLTDELLLAANTGTLNPLQTDIIMANTSKQERTFLKPLMTAYHPSSFESCTALTQYKFSALIRNYYYISNIFIMHLSM